MTYTVDYTSTTAVITGFSASASGNAFLSHLNLEIPSSCSISGTTYNINGIAANAFKNQTILKTVQFPASIVGIGESAFEGCTNLTAVGSLTTKELRIGSSAFKNCTKLANIVIPSRTSVVGANAFYGCNSSQGGPSVLISKSSTNSSSEVIADNLLNGQYVKSVEIASGITTIGEGAFKGISNLSSVTLPSSLTTIGATAFQGCTSLTSVDIPAKVTSIGNLAFDCANLTQVKVNWYTPLQITGDADPFPQKATEDHSLIAPFALDQYYVNDAYWGQFKSIEPTPTYVNDTGLVYGWVGDGTTHVKVVGWQGWTNPTSVLIEPKLYVGDPQNNENLVFDVTEIGDEALKDCTLLQDITIPASVTKIGESAFQGSGLFSITLNEGLQQIGLNAFNGCSSLQTVNVPSSVTELGAGAFSTCEALQTAIIQAQITYLLNQTFQHCSSLTSVSLPSTLTEINYLAFFNCTSLPSIAIPENVNIIGSAAFRNCTSLKDVYFQGATPPDVDLEGQGDLFRNENGDGVIDHSTITLHVPFGATEAYRNHTYWSTFHILLPSEINIDFADAKVKDICVGTETGWDTNNDRELSLAEAAAVTDIGSYFNSDEITTFDEFRYFTSVTTIPSGAFNGCTALTSITFPESLTTIEMWAFQNCSALTNLVIPEGVTTIGWLAFRSYTGIVTLPSTLTSLDSSSFEAAAGAKVSWPEPPAALAQDFYSAFGSTGNKLLYVPIGSYDIYEDTPTWWAFDTREYGNITFADDNVKVLCLSWDSDGDGELSAEEALAATNLGESFRNNTTITSFDELKYFRNLTELPAYAFEGCTALSAITLPNNITLIGSDAFRQSGITAINLPTSLTTIGSGAFSNCAALKRIEFHSGVLAIGDNAFNGTPLEVVVASWWEPISINENVFTCYENATLYVPDDEEVVSTYQSTDPWSRFSTIATRIVFNDPKVKAICVDPARGWDANGDGELTKDEAAAVTTLGTAFTGNTEI
ncbi:MAG: leucine-rich repeat domain-containing protein, partial [Prevotella sp.]|nr:leucine-rich repeat domain-containing protein [Prevotella sp.]